MFAIANPDASLFQRASGRARQARQRLLRQHGWALAIRRRNATHARDPERRSITPRQREPPDGDLRSEFAGGESLSDLAALELWSTPSFFLVPKPFLLKSL